MKALVTGATGFVGKRLLTHLKGANVLSRDAAKAEKSLASFGVKAFSWAPTKEMPPLAALEGVDAVFHLAGDSVAEGRWTAAKKKRMWDSRIEGTKNLVNALAQLDRRPKVLVSASAIGFYGDRGDEILEEGAKPASGYLADLCREWEREAAVATTLGIRVVSVRVGIVLGEKGGALSKMLTPFYLGVGSPLGSGKQYMSWIHIDDLVGMMLFAAENESVTGVLNGTAPNPVTNKEFTKALGAALHRPTFFPAVPGFVLKVALGEFANVLLGSQRCNPKRAIEAGYKFKYSDLAPALTDILKA
ncbi:MAG: TIGR01777 family oxidoreductase [Pirellulales bacterium]